MLLIRIAFILVFLSLSLSLSISFFVAFIRKSFPELSRDYKC